MARNAHRHVPTLQGFLQVSRTSTIPGTRRQSIQNAVGATLERGYVYMPPDAWLALMRLCEAFAKPPSETIELLILNAISGKLKETNDAIRTFQTKRCDQ